MADHQLRIVLKGKDLTKSAFLSAQGALGKFTRAIFSARGAMVGFAGAAGMGLAIKKSLEAADAIGKAADAIGVSTDMLQEYRHAARLSGVETGQLDKSLGQFTKRIGEARSGTGAMVTFLKKYDEKLLDSVTSAKSMDEALKLVFKAMAESTSQTDKAALANAAFGRAGIAMTVMVKDGADGLAAMRQEAQDLGIVMDEDLIRASEKANDELEKLTRVIKVQFMSAAAGLAPEIAKIAQSATDWWKINQQIVIQDVKGWIGGVTDAVKIAIKPFQIWADLWKTIGFMAGGGKGLRPDLIPKKAPPQIEKPKAVAERPIIPAAAKAPVVAPRVKTVVDREAEALAKEVARAEQQFKDALLLGGGTGAMVDEQLRRGVGDNLQGLVDDVEETYNILEDMSLRTSDAMEQSFSDFFFDVTRGKLQTFSDFTRGIFSSMSRITADILGQMAKDWVLKSLKTMLSIGQEQAQVAVLTAEYHGLAAAKTAAGAAGGGGGGGFLSMLGFQHGGAVPTSKPSIVGERGPELFKPSTSGSIVPSSQMGKPVEVNIINVSDASQFDQWASSSRGQNAILNVIQSNPSVIRGISS